MAFSLVLECFRVIKGFTRVEGWFRVYLGLVQGCFRVFRVSVGFMVCLRVYLGLTSCWFGDVWGLGLAYGFLGLVRVVG